jgi:hypothetical protein
LGSWYMAPVPARRRLRQKLDPALRSAIARACGKYGGRIGGPARALRLTPLERSRIAMQGGRARASAMTAEERSAWALYMLKHQPRFWNGTLPRKPVRERAPVSVGASLIGEPPAASTPATREPVPQPIPVVVTPRRERVSLRSGPWQLRPAKRWDV